MQHVMNASEAFEKHFILLTLSLVIVLGIPATLSLVSAPQKIDAEAGLLSGAKKLSRDVASVNLVQGQGEQSVFSTSLSREVGCEANQNLGLLNGAHLRLRTKACGNFDQIQISNKTNGFTAQVMDLNSGFFTSDFMDLSEGDNVIEISRFNTQGETLKQSVHVQRSPSAVEPLAN